MEITRTIRYHNMEGLEQLPDPLRIELTNRICKVAGDAFFPVASYNASADGVDPDTGEPVWVSYDIYLLIGSMDDYFNEPGWIRWPEWGAHDDMKMYAIYMNSENSGHSDCPVYRHPMTGELDYWL